MPWEIFCVRYCPARWMDEKTKSAATANLFELELILSQRSSKTAPCFWASSSPEKYFSGELLAQKHGAVFDDLWDKINSSSNKLAVAADFVFSSIHLAGQYRTQNISHGIVEIGRASCRERG